MADTKMELIYDHADFRICRSRGHSKSQERTPITFSSWSAEQRGVPFGKNFFERHDLEAYYVCSNRNQWFHFAELEKALRDLLGEVQSPFLYGSSMGGYASLYFSRLFDVPAISLSPQILVLPDDVPSETRWLEDRAKIEPIFSERELLAKENSQPVLCFFDEEHVQDGVHLQFLLDATSHADQLTIIDVPFSGHTPVRALASSKVLQELLLSYSCGSDLDVREIQEKSREAFRKYPKGAADYLRRSHPTPGDDDFWHIIEVCEQSGETDFEFRYFMAEAYARVDDKDNALRHSTASVLLYPRDYVILKHVHLLRKFGMSDQIPGFLAKYKDTSFWSSMIEDFVSTYALEVALEGFTSSAAGQRLVDAAPPCPCCDERKWKKLSDQTFHREKDGRSAYHQSRIDFLLDEWLSDPGEFFNERSIDWVMCGTCGFATFLPRPTDSGVDRKYAVLSTGKLLGGDPSPAGEYDPEKWRLQDPQGITADRAADLFRTLEPILDRKMRILDYGGGSGGLLEHFLLEGHDCEVCDYGIRHPLPGLAYVGPTHQDIPDGRSYDLIICSHVLEHLASPIEVCRSLLGKLSDTGFLYAEVPCEIFGQPPRPSEPVTHVNYFSRSNLRVMLERAGGNVAGCYFSPYITTAGTHALSVRSLTQRGGEGIASNVSSSFDEAEALVAGHIKPILNGLLPGRMPSFEQGNSSDA